jgi:hypothetical protein
MNIEGLASPAEYVIIATLVASITQNIKQTKIPNQYMPFVAMGIGVVSGLVAVYVSGDTNWAGGALAGLITAMGTSGGVDAVKALVVKKDATAVSTVTTDNAESVKKEEPINEA